MWSMLVDGSIKLIEAGIWCIYFFLALSSVIGVVMKGVNAVDLRTRQ